MLSMNNELGLLQSIRTALYSQHAQIGCAGHRHSGAAAGVVVLLYHPDGQVRQSSEVPQARHAQQPHSEEWWKQADAGAV